ncbi:MAG: histidine kinase dimerization/phospho-acceptor domain-containing protein, partial [Verrucomicrobiales bacterium]
MIGFHGGFGAIWGSLPGFLSAPVDYILFVLLCLLAVGLISLLLRRSGKAHRTLRVAWILTPLILIIGWILVNDAGNRERDRLRTRIEGLAPTYADELAAMDHASLGLETAADDPLYLRMVEKQKRWLELNRAVADIYTFRKHPDGNVLIVDSETDYDHNGKIEGERESRTEIGEVWEEKNDRLEAAFAGEEAFDDLPYVDRWGTWVSAYVPMRDSGGRVEAVLGVDFHAQEWVAAISRARRAMIGFLGALMTTVLAAVSMITVLRANLVERRRSEAALRQAKEAAEAATNAKSEFLANMSHEIRTPMNGILGMTEVLLGSQMTHQQRNYQELVKHSAESLLSVLNDVLDFSKVEAGMLELDHHEFRLRDSVADALQALGFQIGERPLELACRIDPAVP